MQNQVNQKRPGMQICYRTNEHDFYCEHPDFLYTGADGQLNRGRYYSIVPRGSGMPKTGHMQPRMLLDVNGYGHLTVDEVFVKPFQSKLRKGLHEFSVLGLPGVDATKGETPAWAAQMRISAEVMHIPIREVEFVILDGISAIRAVGLKYSHYKPGFMEAKEIVTQKQPV